MDKREKHIQEKLGWTINPKANAKGNQEPDATDNRGISHQVGGNKKTLPVSYLTGNLAEDLKRGLQEDYSERMTLYYHSKRHGTHVLSYTKEDYYQMALDLNLAYYDRASAKNGGGQTLRLKVPANKLKELEKRATEKWKIS